MEVLNSNSHIKTYAWKFSSVQEYLDHADKSQADFLNHGRTQFVGADLPTWDSAIAKYSAVWEHGVQTVQQFVEKLESADLPDVKSHARRTVFHEDDGDEICIDRLRSGQSFWRKSERQVTIGPTEVTIITDMSTYSSVRSDDVLWRGAASIALAHLLESKGYRVELWAVDKFLTTHQKQHVIDGVCLKRTSDALDVSTLSSFVSSWFFRTLSFVVRKTFAVVDLKVVHGPDHGYPRVPTAAELDYFSRDENRIFISGVFSFHDALSLIKHSLERLSDSRD